MFQFYYYLKSTYIVSFILKLWNILGVRPYLTFKSKFGSAKTLYISIHVCDWKDKCNDGSDEDPAMCTQWNCNAGYWKCKDGRQCLKEEYVSLCDRSPFDDYSCSDKSDEDSKMCAHWDCTHRYWKCKDRQQCIRNEYLCDSWDHCVDKSDEEPAMCAQFQQSCTAGNWRCKDGLQCITENYVCDGDPWDRGLCCDDGSDEDPAMCVEWDCPAGYWNSRFVMKIQLITTNALTNQMRTQECVRNLLMEAALLDTGDVWMKNYVYLLDMFVMEEVHKAALINVKMDYNVYRTKRCV